MINSSYREFSADLEADPIVAPELLASMTISIGIPMMPHMSTESLRCSSHTFWFDTRCCTGAMLVFLGIVNITGLCGTSCSKIACHIFIK